MLHALVKDTADWSNLCGAWRRRAGRKCLSSL